MELMAEFFSVVGALLLSVSCGVLVEEMLIGGLVRLVLSRKQEAGARAERNNVNTESEEPCLR